MFIRQGSFAVAPGKLAELRETYDRDCAPIVRAAPGNLDVYIMEPTDDASPIIACTIWNTEADAVAYDASGTAAQVVAKVKSYFAGPPVLKSYRVGR